MQNRFFLIVFILFIALSNNAFASGCEGLPEYAKDLINLKRNDLVFSGEVEKIRKLDEDERNGIQKYEATFKVISPYKGKIEDKVNIIFILTNTSLVEVNYKEGQKAIVRANYSSRSGGFVANPCNGYQEDEKPVEFLLYQKQVSFLKNAAFNQEQGDAAMLAILPFLEEYNDYTELEPIYTKIIESADALGINKYDYIAKRGEAKYNLDKYEEAYHDFLSLDGHLYGFKERTAIHVPERLIRIALKLNKKEDLNKTQFIQQADLSRENFSDLNWTHSRLQGCDFSRSKLRNINLQDAQLKYTKFKGADLTGANLSFSDVDGADFSEAKLDNVNFQGIIFNHQTIWPDGFDPVEASTRKVVPEQQKQ